MGKPRIFIADDHRIMVEGLICLLQNEFEIVGSASDVPAAIHKVVLLKPDLVLLEIALSGFTGIALVQKVSQEIPDLKILVLSSLNGAGHVREAFRAGVKGYLLKQSASSELRRALQEVMEGNYYVTPSLANGVVDSLKNPKKNPSEVFRMGLTNRQWEVLKWVAKGKAVKEVAHLLNVSPKTVEYHKWRLMRTLKKRNAAELMRFAIDNGIS